MSDGKGVKFDGEKLDWSLLEMEALEGLIQVLMHGASKYPAWNNWQKVTPTRRYWSAMFRHLKDYRSGERNDPESGYSHLSHALACLVFLAWFEKKGKFGPGSFSDEASETQQSPKELQPLKEKFPSLLGPQHSSTESDAATKAKAEFPALYGQKQKLPAPTPAEVFPSLLGGEFLSWLKEQAAKQGSQPPLPSVPKSALGRKGLIPRTVLEEVDRLAKEREQRLAEARKKEQLD
jgi:hypothetical protein